MYDRPNSVVVSYGLLQLYLHFFIIRIVIVWRMEGVDLD